MKILAMPLNSVIVKVIYNNNITYSREITEVGIESLTNCSKDNDSSDRVDFMFDNTSLTYGWTSSGMFTVFHPLTLIFMQLQLSFALKRIFFAEIIRCTDALKFLNGPEVEFLLWDGSYELPTVHINLYFTSFQCVPDRVLLSSV